MKLLKEIISGIFPPKPLEAAEVREQVSLVVDQANLLRRLLDENKPVAIGKTGL